MAKDAKGHGSEKQGTLAASKARHAAMAKDKPVWSDRDYHAGAERASRTVKIDTENKGNNPLLYGKGGPYANDPKGNEKAAKKDRAAYDREQRRRERQVIRSTTQNRKY